MLLSSTLTSTGSQGQAVSVLDNASGAGIIPSLILQLVDKARVSNDVYITAADIDPMYIGQLEKRKAAGSERWTSVDIQQVDLQKQPFVDNDFDYVFSNFGIFFPQDDAAAIRETCRVLKPGGQAGFTTWKKISWWPEVAVPAMKAAFPEAPSLPDVKSLILKGYDDASIIEEKMKAGGFTDVNVHDYEFPPGVDADRFGEACGMLVALALGRLWSKEDVEKYGAPLKTIAALTKYLKGNFEGGTWNGKMTANIVLARKAN